MSLDIQTRLIILWTVILVSLVLILVAQFKYGRQFLNSISKTEIRDSRDFMIFKVLISISLSLIFMIIALTAYWNVTSYNEASKLVDQLRDVSQIKNYVSGDNILVQSTNEEGVIEDITLNVTDDGVSYKDNLYKSLEFKTDSKRQYKVFFYDDSKTASVMINYTPDVGVTEIISE